MRDWVAWHREYDNPDSALSKRLDRVAWHLRGALCRGGDRHLCAGQGHDVPDVTTQMRSWFAAAGFDEVAFEALDTEYLAGVGVHRLAQRRARPPEPPCQPLFTFGSRSCSP
ncbi:MAG TPA: hypothetical protein VFW16_06435 [Streptosporangiaceae bacterium]|nr:hypothetical protein [Streptosporangiaceae bacterium]